MGTHATRCSMLRPFSLAFAHKLRTAATCAGSPNSLSFRPRFHIEIFPLKTGLLPVAELVRCSAPRPLEYELYWTGNKARICGSAAAKVSYAAVAVQLFMKRTAE